MEEESLGKLVQAAMQVMGSTHCLNEWMSR